MEYKLILLVIVLLFIGANLMCSCCRYPIFDYIMGNTGSPIKEGMNKKESGTPGSVQAVTAANKDITEIMAKGQPTPPILNPPTKQGFGGLFESGLNAVTGGGKKKQTDSFGDMGLLKNGLNVLSEAIGGGPAPRDEKIPVNTT